MTDPGAQVGLTNDPDILNQWIGRTETCTETLSPAWAKMVADSLDLVSRPDTATGQPLFPLAHFASHLHSTPLEGLGSDGHPRRGGFLPPIALPRRMWAGSRIEFLADILIGDDITKTSTIESVTPKTGRSGELCFVTVRHELSAQSQLCVREHQDLVYRQSPTPDAAPTSPKPAPTASDWARSIRPDEVMLFRYSAVTDNGHRIHYDRDYARQIEGYEGLVVHGPLTATLLADLAVAETGRRLTAFSFRALAPLIDTSPFTICASAGPEAETSTQAPSTDGANLVRLWAADSTGGLAMSARASLGNKYPGGRSPQ